MENTDTSLVGTCLLCTTAPSDEPASSSESLKGARWNLMGDLDADNTTTTDVRCDWSKCRTGVSASYTSI